MKSYWVFPQRLQKSGGAGRSHQSHLEGLLHHESMVLHQRLLISLLSRLVSVQPFANLLQENECKLKSSVKTQTRKRAAVSTRERKRSENKQCAMKSPPCCLLSWMCRALGPARNERGSARIAPSNGPRTWLSSVCLEHRMGVEVVRLQLRLQQCLPTQPLQQHCKGSGPVWVQQLGCQQCLPTACAWHLPGPAVSFCEHLHAPS